MGRAAPPPVLSVEEREALDRLIRTHSTPRQIALRARMIVLAAGGLKIREIAAQLGVWRKTVSEWRRRWISSSGSPARVLGRLSDAPRPGAPAQITAERTCAIVALACGAPEDGGLPFSHCSEQALADEAVRGGIIDRISQRPVGRILKEADLKPHRVRYWLTAKADPEFPEKAAQICQLYAEAISAAEAGQRTVSVDEMTGIQALARPWPGPATGRTDVAHSASRRAAWAKKANTASSNPWPAGATSSPILASALDSISRRSTPPGSTRSKSGFPSSLES